MIDREADGSDSLEVRLLRRTQRHRDEFIVTDSCDRWAGIRAYPFDRWRHRLRNGVEPFGEAE